MFPNAQEALPLPQRPDLEQYKKRAKDLVKACRSGDADAIRGWTMAWLDALGVRRTDRIADDIVVYAQEQLSRGASPCGLSQAQFVIARSHGFASWPKFSTHVRALAASSSPTSAFEAAADAIVSGDEQTLDRLLKNDPRLARARSTREHNATLLIYTSANGVEGYRQKSPKNAAAIAEMLLKAGAEVDATAAVYRSECTTLGLVATSMPPNIAGVQLAVIEVLLAHGARTDLRGMAGGDASLLFSCLANGQPEAARYLAARGAPLDLKGAAGLGRLDAVRSFFDEAGDAGGPSARELAEAFSWASAYGRRDVVAFLLDRGVDANDATLRVNGEGHTALHAAAFWGHLDVVELLLERGARVDVIDKTWKTPPLLWALTGWARKETAPPERYYAIVERLIAAGAKVRPDVLEWDRVRADPNMRAALGVSG